MGLSLGFSDTSTGSAQAQAPNPNPVNFSIREHRIIHGCSILLVHYPGCTTFGGEKLLLLRTKLNKSPISLDPHLLGSHHLVMARFEPTEVGWALAKAAAAEYHMLSKERVYPRRP